MSSCDPLNPSQQDRGFSLVELLVALFFMLVLMAGMLKVFTSNITGFAVGNEVMRAQRQSRLALDTLRDDASTCGFTFPYEFVPDIGSSPFQILPNMGLSFTDYSGSTIDATTLGLTANPGTQTLTNDYVIFSSVIPINITVGLSSAVAAGSTTVTLGTPTSGSLTDLKPDDLIILSDRDWEVGVVSSIVSGVVTLKATVADKFGNLQGSTVSSFSNSYSVANSRVYLLHPLRLIRYSIQPMNLNPSMAKEQVPCLVRQTLTPNPGTTPDWSAATTTEIVAEDIIGLKADISFDGGTTWYRNQIAGSDNDVAGWNKMLGKATTQLAAVAPTGFHDLRTPKDPYWIQYVPAILRFDITSRTTMKRQDYNVSNAVALAYRLRQQTLLVTPRNWGNKI